MIGPWPQRRLPHRQARARLRLYCHPTVCASVALSLDCQNHADLDEGQILLSGLPVRDWARRGRAGWKTRDRRSIPERFSTSAPCTNLPETSQPAELSGAGAVKQSVQRLTISEHWRVPSQSTSLWLGRISLKLASRTESRLKRRIRGDAAARRQRSLWSLGLKRILGTTHWRW